MEINNNNINSSNNDNINNDNINNNDNNINNPNEYDNINEINLNEEINIEEYDNMNEFIEDNINEINEVNDNNYNNYHSIIMLNNNEETKNEIFEILKKIVGEENSSQLEKKINIICRLEENYVLVETTEDYIVEEVEKYKISIQNYLSQKNKRNISFHIIKLERNYKFIEKNTDKEMQVLFDFIREQRKKQQAIDKEKLIQEKIKEERRLVQEQIRKAQEQIKKVQYKSNHLNYHFTFSNFVVAKCNEFAYAACQSVIKGPGESFNPLFIYGDFGIGKTHLLQATCHELINKYYNSNIIYTTAEQFSAEFIKAIEEHKVYEFREKYRSADVLIMDDIQFLGRRERTQEEFYHAFNYLHNGHKQIIISADKPPRCDCLPGIHERLISRFRWGLVAYMDYPSLETRIAIVKKKARLKGYEFSTNLCEYIATTITSNIRDLEGAIEQLISFAKRENISKIDLNFARRILEDYLEICKPYIGSNYFFFNNISPTSVNLKRKSSNSKKKKSNNKKDINNTNNNSNTNNNLTNTNNTNNNDLKNNSTLEDSSINQKDQKDEKVTYKIEDILRAVCRYYRINITELRSRRRHRRILIPRQIGMYIAKKYTSHSLKEISGYFGRKDHTTTLNGVRKIERLKKSDKEIKRAVESIIRYLNRLMTNRMKRLNS